MSVTSAFFKYPMNRSTIPLLWGVYGVDMSLRTLYLVHSSEITRDAKCVP